MIISRLVSGLGNQLFQYTIGRELAIRNHTNLKLDISFFDTQQLRAYKLGCFNIVADIAQEKELRYVKLLRQNHSVKNRILRKIENLVNPDFPSMLREKELWQYDSNLLKTRGEKYIVGYWQHHLYYEQLNPVILSELTLRNDHIYVLKHKTDEIQNLNSVAVHIRRGDYVSDEGANKLMGVLPKEYYQNAIKIIESIIPNPVFYLFSDDIPWVKENFKHLNNKHFVEGYEDYEDLILMSNCKHNIIANSSFSWWGAFLNANKNKIVIAPNQWVPQPEINQKVKIQMPNWIKI